MSSYRIEFAPAAVRQLEGLHVQLQRRVSTRIDALTADPRPPGCRKLKGANDIYRVRVGNDRVLYQVKDELPLVLVVKIGHRREAYKDLLFR